MMKKKNIALAMAAVSVAGTVAPAFAAVKSDDTAKTDFITLKDFASLESKIKNMIGKEYAEGVTTSSQNVFDVQVRTTGETLVKDNEMKIKTEKDLKTVSDAVTKSAKGTVFNFVITDNGHEVKNDGTITNMGVNTYTLTDIVNANFTDLEFGREIQVGELGKYTVTKSLDETKLTQTLKFEKAGKVELTLSLKAGDKIKDFKNPTNTNGKLTGFGLKEEQLKPKTYNVTVSNAEEKKIVVTKEDIAKIAEELKANYTISEEEKVAAEGRITEVDGKQQTVIFAEDIKIAKTAKTMPEKVLAQITLTANTKEELVSLLEVLKGSKDDFTVIEGAERKDTAIELSKKNYNTDNKVGESKVKNVVLVNEYAIVDGLSAAPLAAKKDAPLLLTGKDNMHADVKAEIKRVLGLNESTSHNQTKTVYLVGGDTVISKDVELELVKMGVKVVRFDGVDREDTSRKIATEMGATSGKAFVVDGYKGLADAMSISPVASMQERPIVVVNGADELNKESKDFLKGFNAADVIGGDAVVTEKSLQSISDVTGSAKRVAGNDRLETNAKVISTYFAKTTDNGDAKGGANEFYVAKDGYAKNDQLVDALAAAPIANAPIVLATENVSVDQAIAISGVKNEEKVNLTQVGGGVKTSVIDQLKKLVGINK